MHRFGDRDGHQVFLEPEGLNDPTVYPNGISTSLPIDAQQAMIASIPGLERARITTSGYAVEYDYLDPRGLTVSLAVRAIEGLYCAGQVNGTTGYEEAAGQGLVAGVNAAAAVKGRAPLMLDRASSYLGVMIDDLVLQGVTEPYRMLTARAEYRLSLRADNAETRLTEAGLAAGCLSAERQQHVAARGEQRRRAWVAMKEAQGGALAESLLRGEDAGDALSMIEEPADIVAEVATTIRYQPYVDRQAREIEQLRREESDLLSPALDYDAVPGLSLEMIERLSASRPRSLAAASRIRGITPAALSAILLYTKRRAA